jgi:hypothetical protein
MIRLAYAQRSLVEVLLPDGKKLWDHVRTGTGGRVKRQSPHQGGVAARGSPRAATARGAPADADTVRADGRRVSGARHERQARIGQGASTRPRPCAPLTHPASDARA